MLEIKAAMGKIELENIRERMIMGRRARLKRSKVPGGTIRYGYKKNTDHRLIINDDDEEEEEEEAEIVRRVFKWYTQGETNMEIRRRLNAGDVPPRKSNLWSKMTIQNIITFEGYATGEYTTTLDGEVFTVPCPPIISMATWRKAQEVREGNKVYRGRNVKEDYLCCGMIVCPCGWKWGARTCQGGGNAAEADTTLASGGEHNPNKCIPIVLALSGQRNSMTTCGTSSLPSVRTGSG